MKKHKQPEGFAPGIYFGMSDEDYHRDPSLSHSGITNILVSEYDYWEESFLNPNKKYDDKLFNENGSLKATAFGKLAEMYLLEEKKFLNTYTVAGSKDYKKKRF